MTTFRQFPANLIIRVADIAINVMATHSTFLFQISLGGKTWAVLQRLVELWPQQTSLVFVWANVGYSIVPEEDFQKRISTMLPGLAATCAVNMCGQHCQKPDRYCVSYCAGQEHNSCNMLEKPGHPQNWHVGERCFRASSFAGWHAEAHGHQVLGHNHGHNRFDTRGSPPWRLATVHACHVQKKVDKVFYANCRLHQNHISTVYLVSHVLNPLKLKGAKAVMGVQGVLWSGSGMFMNLNSRRFLPDEE